MPLVSEVRAVISRGFGSHLFDFVWNVHSDIKAENMTVFQLLHAAIKSKTD